MKRLSAFCQPRAPAKRAGERPALIETVDNQLSDAWRAVVLPLVAAALVLTCFGSVVLATERTLTLATTTSQAEELADRTMLLSQGQLDMGSVS
jgi:hypothetical protein